MPVKWIGSAVLQARRQKWGGNIHTDFDSETKVVTSNLFSIPKTEKNKNARKKKRKKRAKEQIIYLRIHRR
jgi:hypothetical protein